MTADIVVKSPGIPDSAPVVKQLHESGKTIISEIEFASWYTQSFIIGITGTNGKTTTTRLIYHLLKTGGLDVGLGGNIGLSFAAMVAKSPKPFYVLELSSFQLDGVLKFKPDISLLLNITPDHLDRYHYKMDLYAKAKFKIAENQSENDVFKGMIDHCFYKNVLVEFVNITHLPRINDYVVLPTEDIPSDHFQLIFKCKFRIE
jgi:UDP-N-acetylmuramoylalanine--D-glutamate ligase